MTGRRGQWTMERIDQGGTVRCQMGDCPAWATIRETWQTPTMPAPAFAYLCAAHFAEIHAGPRDGTEVR